MLTRKPIIKSIIRRGLAVVISAGMMWLAGCQGIVFEHSSSSSWEKKKSWTYNGVRCSEVFSSRFVEKWKKSRNEWNRIRKAGAQTFDERKFRGRWKRKPLSLSDNLVINITSRGKKWFALVEDRRSPYYFPGNNLKWKNIKRLSDTILVLDNMWVKTGKKQCGAFYQQATVFLGNNNRLYLLTVNDEGRGGNSGDLQVFTKLK